jgi:hypothetical protein
MAKKVKKTKQKQKQKQQQTVIINIGKTKSKSKPRRRRQSKPSEGKDIIQPAVNPPIVAYQSYQQVPVQFDKPKEVTIAEAPTVKETIQSKPIELPVDDSIAIEKQNATSIFVLDEPIGLSRLVNEKAVAIDNPIVVEKPVLQEIENPKVIYPEEPMETEKEIEKPKETIKRKRGRPPGAKNKPKIQAYPVIENPLPLSAFEPINEPLPPSLYQPTPEVFRVDNPMRISELNIKEKDFIDNKFEKQNATSNFVLDEPIGLSRLVNENTNPLELSSRLPRLGSQTQRNIKLNSLFLPKARQPQAPSFQPDKKMEPPINDIWFD